MGIGREGRKLPTVVPRVDCQPWSPVGKIFAIGDLHLPFADVDQLDWIYEAIDREQPDVVIQVGDVLEGYCFSRFARNVSFITPQEELRQFREQFETFWAMVKQAAPNSRKHQLLGNHDIRITKAVQTKYPEIEAVLEMLDIHSLFRVDGVITQPNDRDILELGPDLFAHHGHWLRSGKPGAHVQNALRSCIVGHSHMGHVSLLPRMDRILYELNAGVVAYPKVLPAQYTAANLPGVIPGYGLVDEYGPRFVPWLGK